jgi:hypothetical protein
VSGFVIDVAAEKHLRLGITLALHHLHQQAGAPNLSVAIIAEEFDQ